MKDKKIILKKLDCPHCGLEMDIRIQNLIHINKSTGEMKKHRYYQYFCSECDSKETGWTTTESDELSLLELNKSKT